MAAFNPKHLTNPDIVRTIETKRLLALLKAGKVDLYCALLDGIKMHLSTEQRERRRVLGQSLVGKLSGIGYGWDPNAIRVGVAALLRAGVVKVVVGQKEYVNAGDPDLAKTLLDSRGFNKAELVLEDTAVDPETLTSVRKFMIKLAKKRRIDETPAAISEAAETLSQSVLDQADEVENWASGSGMPLPPKFVTGVTAWRDVIDLKNPIHRVDTIHAAYEDLRVGHESVEAHAKFRKENGLAFKELSEAVRDYEAIEHRLPDDHAVRVLLTEFRAARDQYG